jgi:DNA-binding transcriptional LysR family regulator
MLFLNMVCYHADPLFAKFGILKVGNLYRQQLRMHAWKFHNNQLLDSQAAKLARVGESHSYGTRAARSGLGISTGDHSMVGYRIPTEWGTLTKEQRAIVSVAGIKRSSKGDFLVQYEAFQCGVAGCLVCGH